MTAHPRRIPTAGTARSPSTRSAAGSSASSAWVDRIASWQHELERKVAGGQSDLASELSEGAALLGVPSLTVEQALAAAVGDRSEPVSAEQTLELVVDAERASFGAWYELFPRSWGGFAGVEKQLPELAELGFDVLYLPPIHPIGVTHRKGRNNAPTARRSDPGQPLGDRRRGRRAHGAAPELGSSEEFASLVARPQRARHRHRARLRDPVLAGSPLAERAPGLVPPPPRRHAQVRREPAQEATRTSTTSTSTPRTGARSGARCATSSLHWVEQGVTRLPRRQPAHQADRLLGVADRRGAGARIPRPSSWPRRSRARR